MEVWASDHRYAQLASHSAVLVYVRRSRQTLIIDSPNHKFG